MNELVAFEKQLQPLAPRFAEVLPAHVSPDRLIRTVVLSVERLPKLLECNRQSLFNAAMSAAILGLEVDGITGQAYLLPFKGRVQLVVGYKGYNTMAARSGLTVDGAVVRDGDAFDYELGDKAYIKHKPILGNQGRIIGAWAVASSLSRPPIVAVLGIDDILAIKAKSPGARMSESPWNEPQIGFPAMASKSAKRRLARSMPLNVMQHAARMEEAFEEQGKPAWISPDRGVIVEGELLEAAGTPTAEELMSPTADQPAPSEEVAEGAGEVSITELDSILAEAAEHGTAELQIAWNQIAPEQRKMLEAAKNRRHKPRAAEVDANQPA